MFGGKRPGREVDQSFTDNECESNGKKMNIFLYGDDQINGEMTKTTGEMG